MIVFAVLHFCGTQTDSINITKLYSVYMTKKPVIHFKDSWAGWRAYSGHACSLNAINIFCSWNYQRIFSDLSLSLSLFYLFWPRFKSVIDYVFVYPPTCLRELRLERSEVTKFSTQFPTHTTQLWNFLSFLQVPTHNACAKHLLLMFLLVYVFFRRCFKLFFCCLRRLLPFFLGN